MRPHKDREVESFTLKFTQLYYRFLYSKKSEAVILLSSYHDSPVVVEYKNKPEMVMDYNKKKT